ncbi:MAG: hypothetical protein IPG48_05815 [Saprospiraceae bacterium]|nr:hypothetical protein [Saprospiraceae bacterium]MBK6665671.1 hypothetical protein [Saprospiraceae bacterium]MBK7700940.1 hypothetical protein [Saprospiraceae bacterium]MBK8828942.1 hypothetical protein [Saprospiraceae bacterium]MBK9582414.1 hypothetical protein [Saprospiraceae bacterium]
MKSLNDNLRDEFQEILEDYELSILINTNRLDKRIINLAFEKLLANKMGDDEIELIKKGRADFETYIINELKSQQH